MGREFFFFAQTFHIHILERNLQQGEVRFLGSRRSGLKHFPIKLVVFLD